MTILETTSEVENLVRDTLAAHQSFFLATAGEQGPWVNGAYFAETGLFTLSLVLEQRGRTLAAIRQDPLVSVIISTGSPAQPFLQAQATARVVVGAEADDVRRVLLAKVPQAEPFLSAPIEAVRLRVSAWRATDIPNGWLPGRDLVDVPGAREHTA
ncbi:pyridoxamine 5'-phosphate oxidase family protein [Umezawaea endophytica]|uniref:Pyridoxamine 5'-phosphate oxidase family protein n=1 Tax=Umezawaea endophytica TaxID=1654476 RepID=A0A9X3A2X7_9PSEU|nr:pyridoxamine 5'-phosphate oxidase family protein [Umezawaea endophytica]MCS7481124.1 pyridoxamine 5'-phosphate oxidase family protein [Umezawaea endophytica]